MHACKCVMTLFAFVLLNLLSFYLLLDYKLAKQEVFEVDREPLIEKTPQVSNFKTMTLVTIARWCIARWLFREKVKI